MEIETLASLYVVDQNVFLAVFLFTWVHNYLELYSVEQQAKVELGFQSCSCCIIFGLCYLVKPS